jgi:hypothetical protein
MDHDYADEEPTEEMILAGAKAAVDQIYQKGGFWDRDYLDEHQRECWLKAMRWGWKAMHRLAPRTETRVAIGTPTGERRIILTPPRSP